MSELIKISEIPEATSCENDDIAMIVQNGVNKKIKIKNLVGDTDKIFSEKTAEGEMINITDSAEDMPLALEISGNTIKETIEAYDLVNETNCNVTGIKAISFNTYAKKGLKVQISWENVALGGDKSPVLAFKNSSGSVVKYFSLSANGGTQTYVLDADIYGINIYSNGYNDSASAGVTSIISNLKLTVEAVQNLKSAGDSGNITTIVTNENLFTSNADRFTKPVDYYSCSINLEKGKTFTLSAELPASESQETVTFGIAKAGNRYSNFVDKIFCVHSNGQQVKTTTFTVDNTYTDTKLIAYASSLESLARAVKNYKVALKVGNTATEYIEHKEQKVTFPLQQNQKLFQGSYLAEDGMHHKRKQIALNGTEAFGTNTNYTTDKLLVLQLQIADAKSATTNLLSNYFKYKASSDEIDTVRFAGKFLLITLDKTKFASAADFTNYAKQQYQNANQIEFEYELEEEVIEGYTEEQKMALEELNKLKTYKDTTNILSADLVSTYKKAKYFTTFNVAAKEMQKRIEELEKKTIELNTELESSKEYVLFENTAGISKGNIKLSDTISNYKRIKVIFDFSNSNAGAKYAFGNVEELDVTGDLSNLIIGKKTLNYMYASLAIAGDTLSITRNRIVENAGAMAEGEYVYITKIIGFKN